MWGKTYTELKNRDDGTIGIRYRDFTTPEKERAGLVEELKEMYREGLEG